MLLDEDSDAHSYSHFHEYPYFYGYDNSNFYKDRNTLGIAIGNADIYSISFADKLRDKDGNTNGDANFHEHTDFYNHDNPDFYKDRNTLGIAICNTDIYSISLTDKYCNQDKYADLFCYSYGYDNIHEHTDKHADDNADIYKDRDAVCIALIH